MQKKFLPIVWLLLCCQVAHSQLRLPSNEGKKPTQFKLAIEEGEAATGQLFSKAILKLPITDLKGQRTTFETSDFKLKEANPETDPYGLQHYHYTQTINGIEVDGAQMRVHVKNGMVESQTGSWLLEVTPRLQSLRASQTAGAILQVVEATLKGKKIGSQTLTSTPLGNNSSGRLSALPDNANLVYVPIGRDLENISPDSVRLAYRFTVRTAPFGNFMYYVDATTGEVLYKIDLVCRMMGVKAHAHTVSCDGTATATDELAGAPLMPTLAPPPPVTESIEPSSLLNTQYSGRQSAVTTKRSDGQWSLKDLKRNIEVLKLNSVTTNDDDEITSYNTSPYLNSSNVWRPDSPNDLDGYATDVLWAAQKTYDFFSRTFNQWKYKTTYPKQKVNIFANVDLDKILKSTGENVNAFFDSKDVYLGVGYPNEGIRPLATLDIVAHEIVHGITEGTSGLRYMNESGAVNEAMSDIFGTAVEHIYRPERKNWTMGEDCGLIFRSMSNPNAYEQPAEYGGKYFDPTAFLASDNGGVHVYSGIMNRWFYLLCEGGKGTNQAGYAYNVSAIGMSDALKIVYLAQTQYITPGMQYYNVSLATFRAARAIFGENATQTKQVQNAWQAVNVRRDIFLKDCDDKHEPNNSYQAATRIAVDVPVQGNLVDFARSSDNKGLFSTALDKELVVSNPEKYSDWYVFTTTKDRPNFQLSVDSYYADNISLVVYKDKVAPDSWVAFANNAAGGDYVGQASTASPKTLQISAKSDPYNDLKPHTYYVRVDYGDVGSVLEGTFYRWQAINSLSNGCYTFKINTSAKQFDFDPDELIKADENKRINGGFFRIENEGIDNTSDLTLSLLNDKQIAANTMVTARKYDRYADQIWQATNAEGNDETGYTYSLKNLNSDKVLETNNNGVVVQNDFDSNKSTQKFQIEIERNFVFDINGNLLWLIKDNSNRVMSVTNPTASVAKSVKMQTMLNENYDRQTWNFNASVDLPSNGEYLIRSVEDKTQFLGFSAGQSLKVGATTDGKEQRWKITQGKNGRYTLVNSLSNMALQLGSNTTADNAVYTQAITNTAVATQNWKILPTGTNKSFKIVNSVSNKPATVQTNKTVVQQTYTGSGSQSWYLDKVKTLKEGYYFLQNRATGLYLDIPASSKENGANPISYSYRGGYNQLFYVQPQADGSFVIENVTSEKALSTNTQDALDQIYQWETDPSKINHRWQVAYTTDGFFKIISKFNGKVIQAGKSASAAGSKSPIVQNTYQLNNLYQQWNFRLLGSVPNNTVQKLTHDTESVSAESEKTAGLTLYPNPAQSRVTVVYELAEGETATIKLLNLTGAGLMSQPAERRETVLDVSQIGTGLYFINVETNTGKRQAQKLVIQK
jgi:Zn-dependent metalloprotease